MVAVQVHLNCNTELLQCRVVVSGVQKWYNEAAYMYRLECVHYDTRNEE